MPHPSIKCNLTIKFAPLCHGAAFGVIYLLILFESFYAIKSKQIINGLTHFDVYFVI